MKIELKEWVIPTAVGVTSFGAGLGIGYIFGRSKNKKNEDLESQIVELEFKFEERDEKINSVIQQVLHVIRELKDEGQTFLKKQSDPVVQAAKDMHIHNEKGSTTLSHIPKEEEILLVNVFSEEDDDWDYEEELKTRGPDHPYIIHRDEYFSNELDYSQASLTYYNGDNILCDDQDVPIYNPETIVGKLEFGHGSRDPNIVYVRNEHLLAEYEVLFDNGSYQIEVLGDQIQGSIKHSYPILKFREE